MIVSQSTYKKNDGNTVYPVPFITPIAQKKLLNNLYKRQLFEKAH